MGTQFFWIFDLTAVVVLIVFLFKGLRKGFISVILELIALVVAFAVALPASEAMSKALYDNMIKDVVNSEINDSLASVIDSGVISELKTVDMGKAKINGREISELNITPDSVGKAKLDMSKLDVSETGIDKIDLSAFGISSDTVNYSSMNLGSVEFTAEDLEKYGVENNVLAVVLSENLSKGPVFSPIYETVKSIENAIPPFLTGISESSVTGSEGKTVLKNISLCIINASSEKYISSITDNLVKPFVLVPLRALIFVIIFVIILIILGLLSKLFKGINKIPLIGGVNRFLGAAAGLAEGMIAVFLICIFIQLVISLSGNDLIFLNTMTIDESSFFRKIYYFEFLDFMV